MSIDQDDEQTNPECVIFDIDGTISDAAHRIHLIQGGQNWEAFHAAGERDPIFEHVRIVYASLYLAKMRLVICTGRPDTFREMTIKHLNAHLKLPFDVLLMRADGDWRIDELIKYEMLEYIRNNLKWRPVLAIDDRPSVARMFLRNGVPVLLNSRNDS